ncbi:hypothetical protein [Psychrobacter piscatorii]|uniref:Uncharacterized protein n=1 Tax=Psychrobacter piscatorii TaxID=554343 RepID=A0A0T6DTX6_9GAMM|nr:hypothetical protein [Psychrobacter piscatorii]KRU23291.1 hypothetical protein AS194_05015 [Psychrobacter piscatorii]
MILTIDTTALDADNSESYAAWRGDNVEVQLDGKPLKDCLYCNVDKGVAICVKRDLSGHVIIVGGDIAHEMRVGEVTVEHIKRGNNLHRPGKE